SPTARLREFCKRLQKAPAGSPDFSSPGAWRRPCNHFKVLARGEALGRMRKIVTPVILLLVAVVHAPIPAQARLFELLPYNFTTSEPVVLFLTGIALLSLGRFGSPRTRSRDEQVAPKSRRQDARRRGRWRPRLGDDRRLRRRPGHRRDRRRARQESPALARAEPR